MIMNDIRCTLFLCLPIALFSLIRSSFIIVNGWGTINGNLVIDDDDDDDGGDGDGDNSGNWHDGSVGGIIDVSNIT